jgi:hypothetical protein
MTSPIPGRLHVDPSGRAAGPAAISYNDPWPCVNGTMGVTRTMRGVVLHTMAGTFEGCIKMFNDPGRQASANFAVAQDGRIHQFGPLGKGWESWHAVAANLEWYGIETEDGGHPETPISDAGLQAWAQLYELLSAFAGFPLQVTNDCHGRGLAYHRMCKAWNPDLHSCPGASFTDMTRVNQRAEIIRRARLIRYPVPLPYPPGLHVADGAETLAGVAARQLCDPAAIWWQTAAARAAVVPGADGWGDLQRRYLNTGDWDAEMPAGMRLWLP